MDIQEQVKAAVELLTATKRNLQIVDEHIAQLRQGRPAIQAPSAVSTEHRVYWLGTSDDIDMQPGVNMGDPNAVTTYGPNNPKTGTIRNQEDAAFVCTDIMVACGKKLDADTDDRKIVSLFSNSQSLVFDAPSTLVARFRDGDTGRHIVTGKPDARFGPDVFVPLSSLSSFRVGTGSNKKNALFSEFTIPRAGTVKVDLVNLGPDENEDGSLRIFVTLLGYKVYGG